MLFGILHGTMRWFAPNGRLGLEQLAQECVNALVARENRTGAANVSRERRPAANGHEFGHGG
ncbi:hypothetical protein D9M72_404790 [compost metagenome]